MPSQVYGPPLAAPLPGQLPQVAAPYIPPDQPLPKSSTITKMQKFKTSMCKLFLQDKCTMGEACHFAHGEEDL